MRSKVNSQTVVRSACKCDNQGLLVVTNRVQNATSKRNDKIC